MYQQLPHILHLYLFFKYLLTLRQQTFTHSTYTEKNGNLQKSASCGQIDIN